MLKVKFGTKAELAWPVNVLLLDNKWPLPPSRRRSLIGCLSNPFSPAHQCRLTSGREKETPGSLSLIPPNDTLRIEMQLLLPSE